MRVQRPPRWRGTPAPSPRSPDCSKSPELLPRVLSFHGLTKRHFTSMSPFLRSSSNSLLSQLSPFRQIHRHPSPSFSYPSTTSRSRAPIPSSSSSFHRSLESPLSCSRPSNRTSSLLSLPREKRRLFHLFFRASPSSLSAPVCCSLPSPLLHSAERRESFSTVSGTAEEEGAGKKVEKSIHLTSRAEEKMIEELERRLQGDGGGGGVAVDRRVQGEVLAVSEDFILARGLGEASVGNLVIFSSSSSPPSMGGGVSPVSTEESISQNSSCIGVIFQLLTQDLTVIGLLGTLHDRSSSSVVKPLVGDVCTLLVEKGGKEDKRFSAKNFLDISSCLSSQTSSPSPLSPLSLLSFLSPLSSSSSSSSFVSSSSSSDCATPAPANEKQWNLFSISLSSSSSSPSPSISSCSSSFFSPLLSTGSAVFDTLSPLREGSSTAFLGPPGTGKTTSLLSIIASHLVSTSSSPHLGSPATSHRDNKNVFSSMSTPSPLDLETSSSSPLPSVIFLSLGTSLPSLQRWLYTLKTVALPSALSARSQQYSVGSCEDFVNLSSTNDRDMPAGKRESQQNRDGPLSHQEKEGDISPSSDLDRLIPFNLLALHVPSSSSAGLQTGGSVVNSIASSCLVYVAPLLAMQAAMASQAEGQRVLLVIDHFSLHAAATVHLKESLRRFLSSPSVACHLPSLPVKAFHSSSTKTYTTETFPASRHKEASPGSPSAILPFASMASYVGQLVGGNDSSTLPTTLLSRDKLHSSSLSLLITLDTPPGVRTPGSTSGGGGDLLRQQRQLGEVLKSVIGGDSGIGEALLRRSIEETQEALVSSVDQSIFFSYPESLLAQQSRGKSTVLSPRGKKCSSQQNPVTAMGPVYPMIDLESLLVLNSSSSPPLLVADGCAVLSASCFSPALQENFPQSSSSQALIEALKDICRRRYLSLSKATTQRHNIARSSFHTRAPQKGDDVDSSGVHTPQGGTREIGASNAKSSAVYNEKHSMEQQGKISPTERSFFSPQPALITCVAASAFAWQQRILRMQTERQAMMATLKIFVDTWEVEDLASLQIAAGVCTAQRAGRVFSQAEQVILLRAAATLLFAPPTEEIEERFSHTAHHPTSSFSPFSSSSTPQRRDFPLFSNSGERIVTFDEACSFQEEILRLFKEENFHTFRMLETYLSRSDERNPPYERYLLESNYINSGQREKNSSQIMLMLMEEKQEKWIDSEVKELLAQISAIDKGLIRLKGSTLLTAPSFTELSP